MNDGTHFLAKPGWQPGKMPSEQGKPRKWWKNTSCRSWHKHKYPFPSTQTHIILSYYYITINTAHECKVDWMWFGSGSGRTMTQNTLIINDFKCRWLGQNRTDEICTLNDFEVNFGVGRDSLANQPDVLENCVAPEHFATTTAIEI